MTRQRVTNKCCEVHRGHTPKKTNRPRNTLTAAAPAIEKNNVFLPSFTLENDCRFVATANVAHPHNAIPKHTANTEYQPKFNANVTFASTSAGAAGPVGPGVTANNNENITNLHNTRIRSPNLSGSPDYRHPHDRTRHTSAGA